MVPRQAVGGARFLAQLAVAGGVLEALPPVAAHEGVLHQELETHGGDARDVLLLAEIDVPLRPAVALLEIYQVLVGAGKVGVDPTQEDDVARALGGLSRLQEELRGLARLAVVVVEAGLDHGRAGNLGGLGFGVESGLGLLDEAQGAGVAYEYVGLADLALQGRCQRGVVDGGQGPFEGAGRVQGLALEGVDLAHGGVDFRQLVGSSQRLGAVARPLIQAQRVAVGEEGCGGGGRLHGVVEALVEAAALHRVVGKVLDGDPPSPLAQGLEAFGDAAVEEAAADGVQLVVEDLADLVVGEGDRLAGAGFEELRGDGLVEGVEELILRLIGDRRELGELEGLAEDGGGAQDLGGGRAEVVEAAADGRLDALGQDQGGALLPAPPLAALADDLALADQGLDHLLDEEGVALGLAVDVGAEILVEAIIAQQHRQHGRGAVRLEAFEVDPDRCPLAVPIVEGLGQRVRAVELGLAVATEEEHAFAADEADEVMEQAERRLVGPL